MTTPNALLALAERATLIREADTALDAARRCRDALYGRLSPEARVIEDARMAAFATLALALLARANMETDK